MAERETDFYAMLDGDEYATQLDHELRWVENRRLISLIGGSGGGNFDVWKIDLESARKVAKRFGVEPDAPTAGHIGEVDEDAR